MRTLSIAQQHTKEQALAAKRGNPRLTTRECADQLGVARHATIGEWWREAGMDKAWVNAQAEQAARELAELDQDGPQQAPQGAIEPVQAAEHQRPVQAAPEAAPEAAAEVPVSSPSGRTPVRALSIREDETMKACRAIDRVGALARGGIKDSQIARAALLLGLPLLEKNPALVFTAGTEGEG